MNTLSDKINDMNNLIARNEQKIEILKLELAEEIKMIKEENSKYKKILKKLAETEATINGIFGVQEPEQEHTAFVLLGDDEPNVA